MLVRNVFFCENVMDTPVIDGKPGPSIVINPTYLFKLKIIPSAFTFFVFIMFQNLEPGMLDLEFVLKHKESGEVVGKTKAQLPVLQETDIKIQEKQGYNLHFNFMNQFINQEGDYLFEIYNDQKKINETEVTFVAE